MRKHDGFTLIELVVTILIVALIAGIAIPGYMGYVRRARAAKVLVELDAILTAAQAANAEGEAISEIMVSANGKTVYVESGNDTSGLTADFNEKFCALYDCTSQNHYLGTIYCEKMLVDLRGTEFENGAVWKANDGNGNFSHSAGWSASENIIE